MTLGIIAVPRVVCFFLYVLLSFFFLLCCPDLPLRSRCHDMSRDLTPRRRRQASLIPTARGTGWTGPPAKYQKHLRIRSIETRRLRPQVTGDYNRYKLAYQH